jgi:hypothetical protein
MDPRSTFDRLVTLQVWASSGLDNQRVGHFVAERFAVALEEGQRESVARLASAGSEPDRIAIERLIEDGGRGITLSDLPHFAQEAFAVGLFREPDARLALDDFNQRSYVRPLRAAVPIACSADLAALVGSAAESLPDDYVPQEADLFAPAGFIEFERTLYGAPIVEPDGDHPDPVDAILWTVEHDGDLSAVMWVTLSKVAQVLAFREMTPLEIERIRAGAKPRGGYVVGQPGWVRFGIPIADHRTARLTLAASLLAAQRIATTRMVAPDRAQRRRASRAKITHLPDVAVLELRRPLGVSAESTGSRPVDWSHRWIVGGHWRNQWYPSEGRHKPIYVHPYVKGPDDKPLVADRVYALKR